MDGLLRFYPTIVSLCEKLSFQELKTLSLVSKEWTQITDWIIINRCILLLTENDRFRIDTPSKLEFRRKYNHVKIVRVDLEDVFGKLPDNLEVLELESTTISMEKLKILQKFKKIRSLRVKDCRFQLSEQALKPTDLVLGSKGLQSLVAELKEDDLSLFQELINANFFIKRLHLHLTANNRSEESKFNDFLTNIKLSTLQEVSIRCNQNINLNDGLEDFFQNHPDLRTCSLNNSVVDDDVIKILGRKCEKLENISLEGCTGLRSPSLNVLKRMKNLKHLNFRGTNFDDEDLEKFNLRQMETFEMSFSLFSEMRTLKPMLLSLANIRVLNLNLLFNIECTTILPFIAEQMPKLVSLTLNGLSYNSDAVLKGDLKFPSIEKLDLSFSELNEKTLCLLFAPKLKTLDMSGTNADSKVLEHFANHSPFIENLYLGGSEIIVDNDVSYIIEHLPNLRKLDLKNCEIGEESFKKLLVDSLIEECKVSSFNPNGNEYAQWKEGFKAFENSNPRDGDGPSCMISNGARSLLIFQIIEGFIDEEF